MALQWFLLCPELTSLYRILLQCFLPSTWIKIKDCHDGKTFTRSSLNLSDIKLGVFSSIFLKLLSCFDFKKVNLSGISWKDRNNLKCCRICGDWKHVETFTSNYAQVKGGCKPFGNSLQTELLGGCSFLEVSYIQTKINLKHGSDVYFN